MSKKSKLLMVAALIAVLSFSSQASARGDVFHVYSNEQVESQQRYWFAT